RGTRARCDVPPRRSRCRRPPFRHSRRRATPDTPSRTRAAARSRPPRVLSTDVSADGDLTLLPRRLVGGVQDAEDGERLLLPNERFHLTPYDGRPVRHLQLEP